MSQYDLVICDGIVIDPSQSVYGIYDIAIANGTIAAIGESIDRQRAIETVSARGYLVVPGLIDAHAHIFPGATKLGVPADNIGVYRGVTTIVDAGSAGATTVDAFAVQVAMASRTQIFALLNIGSRGLSIDFGEVANASLLDIDAAKKACQHHRGFVVGIKCRTSADAVGNLGLLPLEKALQAAKAAGLPLVVHIGRDVPPYPKDVLSLLRPGDIITHVYCGGPCGLIDENGTAIDPEVAAKLKSGIIVDVGHGSGSLTFSAVANGLRQGIMPDIISSDLHTESVNGPVFDLVTTMSKFLAFGMDLRSVIAATTYKPARVLRLNSVAGNGPGKLSGLGTLAIGSPADISVLSLEKGRFTFNDCLGAGIIAENRLEPVFVLRQGVLIQCLKTQNGLTGSVLS